MWHSGVTLSDTLCENVTSFERKNKTIWGDWCGIECVLGLGQTVLGPAESPILLYCAEMLNLLYSAQWRIHCAAQIRHVCRGYRAHYRRKPARWGHMNVAPRLCKHIRNWVLPLYWECTQQLQEIYSAPQPPSIMSTTCPASAWLFGVSRCLRGHNFLAWGALVLKLFPLLER